MLPSAQNPPIINTTNYYSLQLLIFLQSIIIHLIPWYPDSVKTVIMIMLLKRADSLCFHWIEFHHINTPLFKWIKLGRLQMQLSWPQHDSNFLEASELWISNDQRHCVSITVQSNHAYHFCLLRQIIYPLVWMDSYSSLCPICSWYNGVVCTQILHRTSFLLGLKCNDDWDTAMAIATHDCYVITLRS